MACSKCGADVLVGMCECGNVVSTTSSSRFSGMYAPKVSEEIRRLLTATVRGPGQQPPAYKEGRVRVVVCGCWAWRLSDDPEDVCPRCLAPRPSGRLWAAFRAALEEGPAAAEAMVAGLPDRWRVYLAQGRLVALLPPSSSQVDASVDLATGEGRYVSRKTRMTSTRGLDPEAEGPGDQLARWMWHPEAVTYPGGDEVIA